MVRLVKLGQEKIKRATKITESMGSFVEKILLAKPMVDFMLQNVPQAAPAAVPWAGVCMALDMLCKPAKANKANLDGVKYVTAQMEWYCALTDHILDETKIISQGAPIARILSRLREKTIVLYRKLLLFLMQSVSSYHSHQGLVFIENAAGLEDWSASLSSIKDTESDLKASIEHFIMVQDRDALQTISSRANDTMQILGSLEQTVTSYISYQKNKDRSEADRSLLKKLCVVDTPEDMEEIEDRKDKLLPAASDWILGMPEFKAFVGELVGEPQDATSQSQPSCRLLWIKGHAGTGKTMLLIRIVRELTARSASLSPSVCHFFFQYTNNSLNNSMAALRSLVWMLLLQQPKLLSHLQKKNDNTEINFESRNGFFVLRNIFKSMLQDPGLQPVYFIVDALDECNSHAFPAFDDIIYDSLVITDKVKWLVAGRPTWTLKGHAKSLVELDTQTLKEPVQAYIAHQLAQLKDMDGYTDEIIKDLSAEVNSRADNTYLWVCTGLPLWAV
ncbi:hypothetical protein SEUCBS140593_008789 [Sporothrix eucalyptigena]|uniref:NACHT domain-containing protein n=1 Tax=Sporothrix eucalyptigena TaxID=1812306 RepID=A0ABP0CPI4_9PEZI